MSGSNNLSLEKKIRLVSIARISFLTLAEKINLFKNLDSFEELALMSLDDLRKFSGRELKSALWNGKDNLKFAQNEVRIIEAKDIGLLQYEDFDYPALLRETSNAPFVLFYRGNKDCLCERSVSVVGTRMITPDGKQAANRFAYDAVMDGCNVISGLAKGVDGESHLGAVNASFDFYEKSGVFSEAKTVAVLPCGIDTVFPSCNRSLAEKILKTGGCLVSEYVPGTPAASYRFVQRNRIIASLSPATVVIQAPNGSGALITVDFALEYNRDVMFHEACFSENAEFVRENIKKRQQIELSLGEISVSKAERTIESYLDQGAPLISDYKDYVRCMKEAPGLRSVKNQQLMLFEIQDENMAEEKTSAKKTSKKEKVKQQTQHFNKTNEDKYFLFKISYDSNK